MQKKSKTSGKRKKRSTRKILIDRCFTAWSIRIKQIHNYKCEYCGKETYLNSHHFYSKTCRSVAWDIDNGFCLCSGHHTLVQAFSAHKTPAEFVEWATQLRGEKWLLDLRAKKIVTKHHIDYELLEIAEQLEKENEVWHNLN